MKAFHNQRMNKKNRDASRQIFCSNEDVTVRPKLVIELFDQIDSLEEALSVSANQLEGVSLAVKKHGHNINTDFFIYHYATAADAARQALNKSREG